MSKREALNLVIPLTEGYRAAVEWGSGVVLKGYVNRNTRSGQGLVMTVPGFLEDGLLLNSLGRFLKSKGFTVSDWGLGRNFGPSKIPIDQFIENIIKFSEENGDQPVHLVGHSLGGVYSVEAAKRLGELSEKTGVPRVASVNTFGSPVHDSVYGEEYGGVSNSVSRVFSYFNHPDDPVLTDFKQAIANFDKNSFPADIPVCCISSKWDGIVKSDAAKTTLVGDMIENVDMPGSHAGMGHNPLYRFVLLDRLTQPKGNWKPFDLNYLPLFARATATTVEAIGKYVCPE